MFPFFALRFRDLPATEVKAVQLQRDAKVAEDIYVLLLNRVQELSVQKAGTGGNVHIVDGMATDLTIETPLMWIDKAATWDLARQLGGAALVDLIRTDTHTCYLGERGALHDWGYGCGKCPACELRARGYEQFSNRA